MKLLQRSKIVPQPNGCHLWVGAKTGSGYGRIVRVVGGRNRNYMAHRVAWEESRDMEVPPGKVVLHTCGVPACVNPEHLYADTRTGLVGRQVFKYTPRHIEPMTHCRRGHAFSGENLYINPSTGGRVCRTCQSARAARSYVLRSGAAELNFQHG